ncbi:N-6 DNA methylase [Arundinibacter roseus]|uniref:site-specific DNA-methyltransferase (adenine-specific) n=1 Tax=Arundinibacter roseus TaxID=2070510 RepID=A0A4R4JYX6_9BACT|nr:N-6 DNA methylase [Arundinibacter roseus]TDB60094.1 hypothetical protein EZE20_21730 [Arundinibacter roseus]
MSYLMDAPRSVEPMIRVLREMGKYRYDPSEVFRDWIDYAIACFLVEGDKELAQRLEKKYEKTYPKMQELLLAWFKVMDQRVTDSPTSWFDALGTIYEYLASQSKRSWMGQFFTPPDLCDLMTQLTSDSKERPVGKRVNDPASGSGRLLLSFNAFNPGNFLFAEDLDAICAKMSALNMAIHGCQGQVCCLDSIALDKWWFGYQINYFHQFGIPPIPHLQPITKEQSETMQHWERRRQKLEVKAEIKPKEPVSKSIIEPIQTEVRAGQLSLF